ncbi:MAG: hypothetical protein Q3X95_00890 [Duodenibacillus sp.]|nr:hypothetical protein [Duodenibacillus sp.]
MAKGFSRALLMKRRAAAKALRANAVEKAASLVSPESICVDGMSMALSCRYVEDASSVSGDALGSAEALVFLDSGDVADLLGRSELLERAEENDPELAQAFAARLAQHPDSRLRQEIARCGCLDGQSIRALAKDASYDVRMSLMENVAAVRELTFGEILAATGNDTELLLAMMESARRALYERDDPRQVVSDFARLKKLRMLIEDNPDGQLIECLEEIQDEGFDIWEEAVRQLEEAQARGASKDELEAILDQTAETLRNAPARPRRLRLRMRRLGHGRPWGRFASRRFSKVGVECRIGFVTRTAEGALALEDGAIKLDDDSIVDSIALIDDAPGLQSVLLRLAGHPSSKVREAVAESSAIDETIFDRLSRDASGAVRRALLQNAIICRGMPAEKVLAVVGDDPSQVDALCSSFDLGRTLTKRLIEKFKESPDPLVQRALEMFDDDDDGL